MNEKPRVLFLCTHNAARSQLAEAILRRHAGTRFEAASAGLEPTQMHPLTRQVLDEIAVDTTALRSKPVSEFLGKVSVQYAIIVCERAEDVCPRLYPFTIHTLHWPFADPQRVHGVPEAQLQAFRDSRDAIDAQVRTWLQEV